MSDIPRDPTSGVLIPKTEAQWRELLDDAGLTNVPVPSGVCAIELPLSQSPSERYQQEITVSDAPEARVIKVMRHGVHASPWTTQLTVGRLRDALAAFDQDAPVLATWEGQAKGVAVIPDIDPMWTDEHGRPAFWLDADLP